MRTHEKDWDLALLWALWAYRVVVKEGTHFSPFHLVYGKEALLPLEVEIPAFQMVMTMSEKQDSAYTNRLLDFRKDNWIGRRQLNIMP